MRFIVTCDVEAEIILPRRLQLQQGDRTLELEISHDHRWNLLRVTSPVRYQKRFKWGMEPVPEPRAANAAPFKAHCEFDKELFESIIADIQALESNLALFFPVKRIDWGHPVLNVEFESNDRRDPAWGNLENFHVNPKARPSVKANEQSFVQLTFQGLASHHLTTIASFWREGENEMFSGRFINAFYNFYFVLEGLYGNGKWNNREIEAEFKSSSELGASIDACQRAPHQTNHIQQIFDMLPDQKKRSLPTHDTLIELIIRTRNRLHHFSNDPKKVHGSPLNHAKYEGIAVLVRFLAHTGLVKRALEIKGVSHVPVE